MSKIIVFENYSLDGFTAGPEGELHWTIRDDEVTKMSQEGQESKDLFLFGRKTYEMMAGFWPTPAGQAANPVFAEILTKTPKIVFSATLKYPEWENTTTVKEITREGILRIKQETGKNIMILGSVSIVQQLAGMKLIDEYQLMINPVVLGKGRPLFPEDRKQNFRLLSSRIFKSGIVLLTYAPLMDTKQ
jgi:dihydrofolate reductase